MPNRPSRLLVSIPNASPDGHYYGRWPQGDKPVSGAALAADAHAVASAGAPLSVGIKLAAQAGGSSSGSSALNTAIRMRANAAAIATAGATAALDPSATIEAAWQARATAPGVFFKNNFNFASTAALKASNYGGAGVPSSDRLELETVNVLSGKGCRINVLKGDGEGTGSYRHDWNAVGSQNKGASKKELYYQFAVYLPKYILDHRFKTLNNAKKNHKWAIIQEPDQSFGRGEVVVITPFFRKCVGAYRIMGSGPLNTWRDFSGTPANPNTPDHAFQTIDAGPQSEGGLTDATSQSLFERRHGFLDQHMSGTTNYGGGTLEAQGQPDPDGAVNGIVWIEDAWNVVEVYVNEATDTVRVWHAEYGLQPDLVINAEGTADLGNRAGNYTGAQLLPRLEEREGDVGREDTYAIYGELLGSTNFIEFPGGFGGDADPTEPDWLAPVPLGVWEEISGPSPDLGLSATPLFSSIDPDPCPAAVRLSHWINKWISWNSACVDMGAGASGAVYHYGSGHTNGYHNDVAGFDLATRTPYRVNDRAPSSAGPFDRGASLTNGAFVDGTQAPPHTYNFLQFHPPTRSLVCLKSIAGIDAPDLGQSSSLALPWMYSVVHDQWRRGPQNTQISSPTSGCACYDSTREVFWTLDHSGGDFGKYDPVGDNGNGTFGSWVSTLGSAAFSDDSSIAHDPVTDRLLILNYNLGNCYRKDPNNMGAARVAVSMTNTPTLSDQSGFEWSNNLGGFVYIQKGTGNVYLLKTTDGWVTGNWTPLTVSTNGKSFTVTNGYYGRARVIEFGSKTIVYLSRNAAVPVQIMRLT